MIRRLALAASLALLAAPLPAGYALAPDIWISRGYSVEQRGAVGHSMPDTSLWCQNAVERWTVIIAGSVEGCIPAYDVTWFWGYKRVDGDCAHACSVYMDMFDYRDDVVSNARCQRTGNVDGGWGQAVEGSATFNLAGGGLGVFPLTGCSFTIFDWPFPPPSSMTGPCRAGAYWKLEMSADQATALPWPDPETQPLLIAQGGGLVTIIGEATSNMLESPTCQAHSGGADPPSVL